MSTTGTEASGANLTLTGRAARWVLEQAEAEQRSPTEVVEEALTLRWGRQLGDAYRGLWEASPGLDQVSAEELVDTEVYAPRRRARRV
jgi:hypothetical protein